MRTSKKFVRSILSVYAGNIATVLFGAIFSALIARSIPIADFGNFQLSVSIYLVAAQVSTFGLTKLITRSFAEAGYEAFKIVKIGLLVIAFNFFFMFAVLQGINSVFLKLEFFWLMSIFFLFSILTDLLTMVAQLKTNYWNLAQYQIGLSLIKVVTVYVSVSIFDVTEIYDICLIISSVLLIYLLLLCPFFIVDIKNFGHTVSHRYKFHPTNTIDVTVFSVLKSARYFAFLGCAYVVYFQSFIILLKFYATSGEIAAFSVAFYFINAVFLIPSIFYQKLIAADLHFWFNRNLAKWKIAFQQGLLVFLVLGISFSVTIYFLSEVLILFAFGIKYSESVPILQVLCVAITTRFMSTVFGSTMLTDKFLKYKAMILFTLALVNVLILPIFLSYFGTVGIAYNFVFSEVLLLAAYVSFSSMVLKGKRQ